jgi:GNAT superfamily N-acetyltransferase
MEFDLEKIDFGSFGGGDGLESTVQDNQLNASISEAVKINPDQQAKVSQLSQQSGIPEFAVADNPEQVESDLNLSNIDVSTMSKRSPNTAKYLTDFNNASIAHDDIDVMQSIEDVFDFGKTFENLGESISASFTSQGAGFMAAGVDMTPSRIQDLVPSSGMPIGMEGDAAFISMELASNLGIDTDAQLQQAKVDATEQMLTTLKEQQAKRKTLTPEDLNLLEQGVRSGVESLANMAPGFGLMLLSGGRAAPLLATIGVQTFGDSYAQGRADNLTPQQAAWFASINAAIEVGTELLPTGTLETILTGKSTGLTKSALKFLVQEMGTEQLATLGQTLNENAFGIDEQMEAAETVEEMVTLQLRRQAVTAIATIVAGGAQATAVTGIRKTIEVIAADGSQKETQGEVEQRKLDQLNTAAEKSKLKKRSKESFKQFVEQADGDNNTHVFIDGAQTSLYLQTKTRDEIAADPALALLQEGVNEAAALGGQVNIPVAEFSAEILNTEHFDNLRDSMTLSDQTIAPFRQEQVRKETETFKRTLLDEANDNISEYVEVQTFTDKVFEQLVDTGQVSKENARVMSTAAASWLFAKAKREGIPVAEAAEKFNFTIEGPLTGEQARLQGEQDLLSQEPVTTESVKEFSQNLEQELGLKTLFMFPDNKGNLKLETIIVKKDDRKSGTGTAAMERIVEYADQNGLRVTLTPAVQDDFQGTTSRARLVKFYKRFGFVENKGRNKDFEISESMFREPQQTEQFAQAPVAQDQEQLVFEFADKQETVEAEAAIEKGLDMSHEARMQRARDMGYDTDTTYYHGTDRAGFKSFDMPWEGKTRGTGVFFTDDLEMAQTYQSGRGEDAPVFTGAQIFEDPSLVDAEVTPQFTIVDADGELVIQEGFDTKEELLGDFDLNEGDVVAVRYDASDNEGYDVVSLGTKEEVVAEFDSITLDQPGLYSVFLKKVDPDNFLTVDWKGNGWDKSPTESWDLLDSEGDIVDTVFSEEEAASRVESDPDIAEFQEELSKTTDEYVRDAQDMGFGGVLFENISDPGPNSQGGEEGNVRVVFNASEIRSIDAAFDPEFKGSDLILAQPTSDDAPGARGYYDPANSIIRLTESSDLSTFLHEFAHFMYEMEVNGDTEMLQSINNWYKRNADDVAKEANSYLTKKGFDAEKQAGTEPGDTVTAEEVTTYLDNKTTGDADKDSAIRRAVHEQFARGFETYLMEGKAPSIELRNAFRTFARWLSQIYQRMRGQLNVDLTIEMRQVFDRLLATEEQIAAAEARQRVEPMFTDAVMAGMTEEEFSDYQKRISKVKDVQSETLRDKLIKQLTRQQQKWWNEEKRDIADEEIERLKTEQVHVARDQLKTGDIKLDFATVKEMVGEEKVNKLGRKSIIVSPKLRGMTAKEHQGLHPDEAAAILGYDSGSELLDDLINAPSIKESADIAAESRMVDRHGDIMTDGTIEKAADEAVQDEERGKLLLSELKTLARGTNAPTVDRATIKEIAAERIGRLSFRQIFPGKYRSAEIKAANEAGRMLAEGNKEGAAAAKMRQVLNYYLGMEATNAKNETTKIVDRMARYSKKKVQVEIMKSNGGHWEQIVKILNRFEFRKAATLTEVENINTWVKERMETDGDGLVLSAVVLNESFLTHWKNVPFSDLQGINDSVKNIEHVARYSNKMNAIADELEFKKLKADWVDSINTNDARFDTKASKSRTADAQDATLSENVRRWASQLTKVPFLASWLDGGERVGLSHQILIQPLTDALDAKMNLIDTVATPVNNAIIDRSKADQKRHMRKIWIPEINDHLLGHQVLAVALNTGNQGNLRKLLLGEGWADPETDGDISIDNPQLQAVLRHMTKSDWELVQTIWDQMETLYPQLAEVHRRTTGLTPPKVESTPVVTEFGTFRGGYYPIKYSPERSHKAEKNAEKLEAETSSMFNNTASIQASVNAGATNERTGFYDRINLSLDVVPDHFNETIHYITHHDAVRQINKLINAPDVANAITGVLGEAEFKQLKPWLNDVAKDGRQQPTKTFIDEAFQRLRFGVTLGVMGFKASTGIMQVFGLFTTTAELGLGPTVKGIQSAIGNSWYMKAIRNTLGTPDNMQSGMDFALEKSKVLPHRIQTMDREIRNAMTRLKGKRGIIAATQEVSMKHIMLIQLYIVDLPTWLGAYDKKVSETGDEKLAAQFADLMLESLQGSGATKDMAAIVRNQSKVITTFTMFMTFFSALGNLSRDLVKGARTGRYSPTSVAAKLMFLYTIPVFMEMLMRGDLGEPEGEDDRLSKYATAVALYPLASIPFVREVASGLIGDFGYNQSPVASMLEKGISGFKGIATAAVTDKEVTKAQIKNATKLVGAALGVPGVSQTWSTGEHLYDVIEEGEELTVREALFGPKRD